MHLVGAAREPPAPARRRKPISVAGRPLSPPLLLPRRREPIFIPHPPPPSPSPLLSCTISQNSHGGPMPNRLANETSPYLLQHANNPVDWFPWGPEALQKARDEDKPILLSVGYSACHWCHVMERESFENPAIARLMNRSFVNIKVDREERPRRRRHLHAGRPGHHRPGRLAHDRLPHPRRANPSTAAPTSRPKTAAPCPASPAS